VVMLDHIASRRINSAAPKIENRALLPMRWAIAASGGLICAAEVICKEGYQ